MNERIIKIVYSGSFSTHSVESLSSILLRAEMGVRLFLSPRTHDVSISYRQDAGYLVTDRVDISRYSIATEHSGAPRQNFSVGQNCGPERSDDVSDVKRDIK